MRHSLFALVGLGIAVSGCASVIKGSTQSMAISTPPTTAATCTLSSAQGNWTVLSPGVASVEKSKEDIQIRCTKPAWQDAASTIPSNFEGWTLGNLVLGGVIGLTAGGKRIRTAGPIGDQFLDRLGARTLVRAELCVLSPARL